jgi:hypothetical protein
MSDITNVTAVETHDTQELTSKQVFEQINKIREDNAHIFDALRQLETVKSEGPQDIGAHGRAQGIADVVKCRETTNQRLLDFYERAYNDLREQEIQAKKEAKDKRIEKIELVKSIQYSMLDQMRRVLDEDDLRELANSVKGKIDALYTDVLNDRI